MGLGRWLEHVRYRGRGSGASSCGFSSRNSHAEWISTGHRITGNALALVLTCLLAWGAASGEAAPVLDAPSFSSSLSPGDRRSSSTSFPTAAAETHLLDDALYASIAGYRTLDYLSTRRALAGGAHEVMLPQWVVDNRGTFITFEGLATLTEVGSSVWLIRHGHRRIARAVNAVSIGVGLQAVVQNYRRPLGAPPP